MDIDFDVKHGLEGVAVAISSISYIDGEKGKLVYRGFEIEDLVENSHFEETAYLIWFSSLPNENEIDFITSMLAKKRTLPKKIIEMMKSFPKNAHPMGVLRSVVSLLGMYSKKDSSTLENAINLTAKIPTIIAYWYRIKNNLPLIPPKESLKHSENFLYMMFGEIPKHSDLFDKALILHLEQGMNASTFASTVTASTLSDIYSIITTAIGTLKGPLHGGANEKVLNMFKEIKSVENVEPYIYTLISNKEKIMGFGHRIYKTYDPRAKILKHWIKDLFLKDNVEYFEIALKVEEIVIKEFKEKKIFPNVDFYSGILYNYFNIPSEFFTTIFAMARIVGWTAHAMEYRKNNRIFRPRSIYNGPKGLKYKEVKGVEKNG
ncbi:citrate synthase [Marinitoga hydrogenitolerans DSM 16785]|uniref:Citrate synthase n=1 Tax=Marinitoga hydrogenitolerans (strain DSM 16785 / JCM 12826 / AT1271) TaxID=1122195 RepID=A0A1M4X968_MARH1|nr:citrate/2-methylcitrate synthase [Marinitoga hydrogenitolerans]SHE90013.1 citrate synthase [Marinitoga hydrogenitolerans DSM 16785]